MIKTKLFQLKLSLLSLFLIHLIMVSKLFCADIIVVNSGEQCGDSYNQDQGVYALNLDGTQKWFFKACRISQIIQLADGSFILLSKFDQNEKGKIYAINPDGSQKWFKEMEYASGISLTEDNTNNSKIIWDIYNDSKKGVPEAIDALKSATQLKN